MCENELISWLTLGIQAGGLIALVLYVWKTWEMAAATRKAAEASLDAVQESRDARVEELAPRILVYFDATPHLSAQVVIQNVGRGTAGNVILTFDPALQTTQDPQFLDFFKTTQSVVPPGYRIEQMFDAWPAYFASTLPRKYQVVARYDGLENGKKYEVSHTLDIDSLKDRVVKNDMNGYGEIYKTLEHLSKQVAGLSRVMTKHHYSNLYRTCLDIPNVSRSKRVLWLWQVNRSMDPNRAFVDEWSSLLEILRIEALAASVEEQASTKTDAYREALQEVLIVLHSPESHAMGNIDWFADADAAFTQLANTI